MIYIFFDFWQQIKIKKIDIWIFQFLWKNKKKIDCWKNWFKKNDFWNKIVLKKMFSEFSIFAKNKIQRFFFLILKK